MYYYLIAPTLFREFCWYARREIIINYLFSVPTRISRLLLSASIKQFTGTGDAKEEGEEEEKEENE